MLDDAGVKDVAKVKRVLLCSGKIYYDLLDRREKEKRDDIAIVRIEQLAPLPQKQLDAIAAKYKTARFIWVQEEPYNMGAYSFLKMNWKNIELFGITRKASASPATGFMKAHVKEQLEIIDKAFE